MPFLKIALFTMLLTSLFICPFTLFLTTTSYASPIEVRGEFTILVFGDSLTAGYGVERNDSFPQQLQDTLSKRYPDVRVVNASVSGDTSAGGLRRLNWALSNEPETALVIIELGANDAMRGLNPQSTKLNLSTIISQIQKHGVSILLAGMKAPRNLGTAYHTEFDHIYSDLASEYNIALYPFFLAGVAGEESLNQRDGIHPNRDGVQKIVQGIVPYVERFLPNELSADRLSKP